MAERQTFTKKGRLRTSPMPILYGKEWSVARTFKEEIVKIREQIEILNDFLRDLVEIERQKLQIQETIKN